MSDSRNRTKTEIEIQTDKNQWVTTPHRSWNMSRIGSEGTLLEKKVRKYLFSKGFRYRLNVKALPGKPDIVLKKYKTVIFVNGCFWHQHSFCKYASVPKSNTELWIQKFKRNKENDARNYRELESLGWHVVVIWECEVKKNFEINMQRIINDLNSFYIMEVTKNGS